jgi:hypothetical protein
MRVVPGLLEKQKKDPFAGLFDQAADLGGALERLGERL